MCWPQPHWNIAICAPSAAAIESRKPRIEALLDDTAALRGRRARIEYLVNGFVDFLIRHRHYAVMASTDPAAKRDKLDSESRPWCEVPASD
jgi:hypothetical protein